MSIIWPSIDLMVAWRNLNLPTANLLFLPKVSIGRKTMDCMVTVTNKGRAHLEEKEFEVSQLSKPFVHNLNVRQTKRKNLICRNSEKFLCIFASNRVK